MTSYFSISEIIQLARQILHFFILAGPEIPPELPGDAGPDPHELSIEKNKEIGLIGWDEGEGWLGTNTLYIAGGDRVATERECKDPKINSVRYENRLTEKKERKTKS